MRERDRTASSYIEANNSRHHASDASAEPSPKKSAVTPARCRIAQRRQILWAPYIRDSFPNGDFMSFRNIQLQPDWGQAWRSTTTASQNRSAARQSEGAGGGNIVTSKVAFQLSETDEPSRYVIRLVDRNQIAALAQSEGLSKRISPEPIAVLYDEGSGQLVPVAGFDDTTSQGRIAMRIMNDIYSDVLDRIVAREANRARTANEVRRSAA
jgi:hypothetical protein